MGKEFETDVRSFLQTFGMEGLEDVVKSIYPDIFTGDLSATQFFRALGSTDVLDRARELYPVSNIDITLLKQASASLMQSPEAMYGLIEQRRGAAQKDIELYNVISQSTALKEGGINLPSFGMPDLTLPPGARPPEPVEGALPEGATNVREINGKTYYTLDGEVYRAN